MKKFEIPKRHTVLTNISEKGSRRFCTTSFIIHYHLFHALLYQFFAKIEFYTLVAKNTSTFFTLPSPRPDSNLSPRNISTYYPLSQKYPTIPLYNEQSWLKVTPYRSEQIYIPSN